MSKLEAVNLAHDAGESHTLPRAMSAEDAAARASRQPERLEISREHEGLWIVHAVHGETALLVYAGGERDKAAAVAARLAAKHGVDVLNRETPFAF
jgi:hypothetical protein